MWSSQEKNNSPSAASTTTATTTTSSSATSTTTGNSSAQNLRTLGMTSAISVAEPKPSDLVRTNELRDSLEPYNVFETEGELNHRMEILR